MSVPVVRFVYAGQEQHHDCGARAYTVVYDGACKVCGRLARVLEKWDRRADLAVVPSQAPGVKACFPWIPDSAYRESLQLIGPGGKTWQGAEAIEQLLNVLPRGKLISWIFRIPLVRGMADRFYRWFARNRYKLGCGEHCQLRPQDLNF
ncbi:MAG TPA: DCC1-like thiol-disulfide oxidoreductase family protein [Longimicrobiales bacterium]|nr:DCC1-like thiol-disulfide oxidoreductase family protein [Longimicrobiales bacterium]